MIKQCGQIYLLLFSKAVYFCWAKKTYGDRVVQVCEEKREGNHDSPRAKLWELFRFDFVASTFEKVIFVSDKNHFTSEIGKFMLDLPYSGGFQNIGI